VLSDAQNQMNEIDGETDALYQALEGIRQELASTHTQLVEKALQMERIQVPESLTINVVPLLMIVSCFSGSLCPAQEGVPLRIGASEAAPLPSCMLSFSLWSQLS
jgi:hypothetical protein